MKRLDNIEKRKKQVRAWKKELRKLYKAYNEQEYIKLEKPIRHGWYKHLILREDIARRKDAYIYQEILDRCGADIWGSTKKQADKNWDQYNQRSVRWQFPGLEYLDAEKLVGMSPKARLWFEGYDWKWKFSSGYVKRYYCKVPRYYFVVAYTKAYITKKQIVDPDLVSKIDGLENRLLQNKYYRLKKENVGRHSRWGPFNYNRRKRKRCNDQLRNYDEQSFDYWISGAVRH